LHTLEAKIDTNNENIEANNAKTDRLLGVLGDIKENTAVMAALLKDRQA
jgi:hypothetical protein